MKAILIFTFFIVSSTYSQSNSISTKNDSIQLSLGLSYFNNKQLLKTIDICKKINNEKSYSLLAKSFDQLGDYHQSILYYDKLVFLNKSNNNNLLDLYLSLAKDYKKLKEPTYLKKSIEYGEKAILLSNELTIPYSKRHTIYNNTGNYYKSFDKNKAIQLHKKALKIALKANDSLKIALSYSNLGSATLNGVNSSLEELNKSKYYTKKSISYHSSSITYKNYLRLGIISYLQNDFDQALEHHNKSLEYLTSLKLKSNKDLPRIEQVKIINYDKVTIVLFEKVYAWIKASKESNKIENLKHGLETIELADQLIDKISNKLVDEDSQLYWRKQASSFYNLGATICFNLNLPDKAFYFIEKNKSLLLFDYTIENNLKKTLPKNLLLRELSLKKEKDSLLYLKTISKSEKNQDLYLEKKIELEVFSDSLKKEFPEIYKTIQSKKTYSLIEVKNKLNNHTVYISFIWDKKENQFDALYSMAITKDTTYLYKINGLNKLDTLVNNYNSFLKKPLTTKEELKDFQNNSYELFSTLFPDNTIKKILKNNYNLVILPDSDLQSIPFESLIFNKKNNNYLIETNNIHYAYSMSYLIENSSITRKAKNDYVGYAPLSFNHNNLNPLPNTLKEINSIKEIIGGQNYINDFATKQSFIKNSNSSKIIHLATHSDQIGNPWVGFKNKKLQLHELYSYKNQAELVYLNSCNSSLGSINQGEGIYSLARGFFYSGANSVISSLWNVNDKSNQEITISFYNYLKKGETKSNALRQAKLDYLNSHSLSEKSPYYWSSLILIGNASSIPLYNSLIYYIALATVILLFLFFLIKKLKTVGNKS